jgi:hypothetical protein
LDDIKELTEAWPNLKLLSLNPSPVEIYNPTLSFHAMELFANRCRDLQHLGLFMDLSEKEVAKIKGIERLNPLKHLRTLDVGVSEPDYYSHSIFKYTITFIDYTTHMCPDIIKIVTRVPWKGLLH